MVIFVAAWERQARQIITAKIEVFISSGTEFASVLISV